MGVEVDLVMVQEESDRGDLELTRKCRLTTIQTLIITFSTDRGATSKFSNRITVKNCPSVVLTKT